VDPVIIDRFKCRCCGAVYASANPDGTTYYHACSTILDPQTGEHITREKFRDENIRTNFRGEEAGIITEGMGVVPVAPCTLAEPSWLTKMKTAIAKRDGED
jgi:hypothetical protein